MTTAEMRPAMLAKTASRQVLGVMNEFAFMAELTISTGRSDPTDLVGLSVWLANTIVGPISRDDGSTPFGALRNRGGRRPPRLTARLADLTVYES